MELEEAWKVKEKNLKKVLELGQKKLQHLSDEKLVLQRMNTKFSQGLKQYADEVTHLRDQVRDLTADRETLQDQVHIAQETIFRSAKKTNWAPKEDQRIHEEFTKLEENLKSWVRKYVVAEASTFEQALTVEKDAIVRLLEGYCVKGNWHYLVRSMPSVS